MSTELKHPSTDPLERADAEAVFRHAFEGEPLDPEVRGRVRQSAARITEEIYRTHGLIDDETFQKLLSDDDDEDPPLRRAGGTRGMRTRYGG